MSHTTSFGVGYIGIQGGRMEAAKAAMAERLSRLPTGVTSTLHVAREKSAIGFLVSVEGEPSHKFVIWLAGFYRGMDSAMKPLMGADSSTCPISQLFG